MVSLECGRRAQGWGEARIYTNHRGDNRRISTFSTPNSRSMRTDGFYSIHNTENAGSKSDQMFSSWYSDGIVWWSLANRRDPVKMGQFVPPPTEDPIGFFPAIPLVWGVTLIGPATSSLPATSTADYGSCAPRAWVNSEPVRSRVTWAVAASPPVTR